MDATESAALTQLGEQDKWPVDELPAEIDADVLRCLDLAGLIEACWVVLVNQQKHPGDKTPAAPSQGPWFSPIKQPEMSGGWDRIRSAPPLGTDPPDSARVDVTEVPRDDFGGFFPKRSHRIVSLSAPNSVPSFYVRVTEQGRAELTRLHRREPADDLLARLLSAPNQPVLSNDELAQARAYINYAIGVLEKAEVLRHNAQREAEEAVGQGQLAELQANPSGVLGSAEELNTLKYQFDAMAGPLVQVAYALGIDEAPLDDFIRTGNPALVPGAIRVLRHIPAEAVRRSQSAAGGSAALPQPHVGDELLRYLADRPDEMAAVIELPKCFHDPSALTVSDADGLIEFGTRNHCFVGPDHELRLEKGWNFGRITGPNRKPMKQFIAEALGFTGDERIRPHVRLTAKGRVRVARLAVDRPACQIEPKPKATATDWRDLQRRLLELCERGDAFPTYRNLANSLDCSVATIRKAIKPTQAALGRLDDAERKEAVSTAKKLAGWQARHAKVKGSPRASSLTEIVMDNAEQTREADPAQEAETSDVDTVLARLIQEAQPEERDRLNSMDADQRREIVTLLGNDPDNYDRVLGRKP